MLHRPRCNEHSTVRGPPLQARVVAAYGAVLQLANCWPYLRNKPPALLNGDPGAHGHEQGASKMKQWSKMKWTGARTLRRAVGVGRQRMAGKQPAEQALQANTASGFSARHRPRTNGPQMAGLAANNQPQMTSASRRAGKWGSAVVLALMKAGADLPKPVPTPPIAFACHCPYPLP